MDAKDSFVFLALLLLSLGLFGSLSLTYCVWNKQTEVASELQNEWHTQSEAKSELKIELVGVQNELLMLNIKLQSELADVRNELHELQKRNELADVQNQLHQLQNEMKLMNSRIHLGASEPSQVKAPLKRNVRQADEDDTPSATEILINALTEIIGMKITSYMNCDKNEYNHTKCTLKPGPKGEPGPEGEKGTKGEPGDMGHRGEPGDQGMKGNRGITGYKGEKGEEGVEGQPGPPGIQGKDGQKGEQGLVGPQGNNGAHGLQGHAGEKGEKGDMGERGLKGDMGLPGPQGETGERGDMAQKGEPGNKGTKGIRGEKGEKGEQGVAGPLGVPTTVSTTTPTPPAPTTSPTPGQCGGPGWRIVVFLNMTNTSHVCPTEFAKTVYSRRTCGRGNSGWRTCSSTTFSVGGSQYSRVCGRALAYQWGRTDAFYGYHGERRGLNAQYVDGLSLTHGASGSRQHIWTFASGAFTGSNTSHSPRNRCPCDNGNTYRSPPFVGNDYFCESVLYRQPHQYIFYPNAPLWDGQVCEGGGTCCKFNNPPWFTKNLANSTTNDIELRMCSYYTNAYSDIALGLLELYVQ